MDYGTEIITLPSEGKVYDIESPLASGEVELRIMTAADENILASPNHLKKGVDHLLNKLIQRLAVTPFDPNDLVDGDRTALMIGLRIVSYGKDYTFSYYSDETGKLETVSCNLAKLADVPMKNLPVKRGVNEFDYEFPVSKARITYQLPTGHVNKAIRDELNGLKVLGGDEVPEITTRYNNLILSVNGERGSKVVREFVARMTALDSRFFRNHLRLTAPDVDLKTTVSNEMYTEEGVEVNLSFSQLFFPE